MPSERFESLLAEHLDGALDAAGREELAAELERDPTAARAFDEAVRFESLLVAAHSEPPAGTALADRLLKRVEAAPVLRPADWKSRAMAAAAAAILIAAGAWAALDVFRGGPPVHVPVPVPLPVAENRVVTGRVLVDGVESGLIANGARVEVAGGTAAEIRLADGSTAWLEPKSLAVLAGPVGEIRQMVELEGGAGRFKVEKDPKQFKVETQVGSVTVMGTEFSVELRPREAKGEGQMKGRLGLALAVAVTVGTVQVNYGGKDETLTAGMSKVFGEEGAKEGPRKEEPKKENPLPEGARGFAGQVKGTVTAKADRGIGLKVTEVIKIWEANKAADPKALVGLTIKVTASWVKVEGKRGHPNELQLAFLRKLEVGQEVTLEIRNAEREVFVVTELTAEQRESARAEARRPNDGEKKREGEARDGDKKREGEHRDGDKKREGEGDKAPEQPKTGDGEF